MLFEQRLQSTQPSLWFIEIALKLETQLSIPTALFFKSLIQPHCGLNLQPTILVGEHSTINTSWLKKNEEKWLFFREKTPRDLLETSVKFFKQ